MESQPADGPAAIIWADYEQAAVQESLDAGRVVVLSFSADWCILCKLLERNTLSTDDMQARLSAGDVRGFKVDCTDPKSAGWRLMQPHANSVPAVLVFSAQNLEQPEVFAASKAHASGQESLWESSDLIAAIENSKD